MKISDERLPRLLLIVGVGIPLALVVIEATPLGSNLIYVILGIPGLLLVWAGSAIYSAIRCARTADRRRRFQLSVLPLVVLCVALNPLGFIHFCFFIGDATHFILTRPYYDRRIADLPTNGQPRLAIFDWGGMVWASTGLVYDESDEVSLPRDKQSADWLRQASRTELVCRSGYSVNRLWAHYYIGHFTC